MSYGKFVKELPASLKRHIVAYDNLPEHGGCILYFRSGPKRVDLDLCVLSHSAPELIKVLHELVERPRSHQRLYITVENGELIVAEPDGESQARLAEKSAAPA